MRHRAATSKRDLMANRWIYDAEGKPAYRQEGHHIYLPHTGICEFYENGGWWYQIERGAAAYFVKDDQVFTPNGKPVFHYA